MDVTTSPPLGQSASHLATAYSTIRTSVLADAASKLGIGLDQLRAELDAGKPLAHIAALAGITLSSEATDGAPVVVRDSPSGNQVDLRI